ILIFHFWCYQGFRGEAPNASIEFYSMAKCALRESVFRVVLEKRVSVHILSLLLKNENPIKWGL
ncbi:hypothetical protein, partial [Acinetobacter baumannii]|uniref:hypothetical protein n=1 Tax=Acinetobacter baumannii TaxID=470 RepID=UPI001BB46CDF